MIAEEPYSNGILRYACNERNYNYLPYGYWLANLISKRLDTLREKTQIFLPDGKVQILVSDDEIVEISVNVQHVLNADMQRLNYQIREECLFQSQENDNKSGYWICTRWNRK